MIPSGQYLSGVPATLNWRRRKWGHGAGRHLKLWSWSSGFTIRLVKLWHGRASSRCHKVWGSNPTSVLCAHRSCPLGSCGAQLEINWAISSYFFPPSTLKRQRRTWRWLNGKNSAHQNQTENHSFCAFLFSKESKISWNSLV